MIQYKLITTPKKPLDFPKILATNDESIILLAIKESKVEGYLTGVVIGGKHYPISDYSENWLEKDFKPYSGTVQLNNL